MLEDYLQAAPVLYAYQPVVQGGGGHGGKYAVVFVGGVAAFCKPASGVGNGEQVARNEVAAWVLARAVGWPDLVGASVLRNLPNPASGDMETTAVQILWPGFDFIPDPSGFSDDEIWRAALFDHIINHTDRGNNNWLGVPGAALPFAGTFVPNQQQLKLIDHGFAFGDASAGAVNSTFCQRQAGIEVPVRYIDDLRRLEAAAQDALSPLLPPVAIEGLLERVRNVVTNGTI